MISMLRAMSWFGIGRLLAIQVPCALALAGGASLSGCGGSLPSVERVDLPDAGTDWRFHGAEPTALMREFHRCETDLEHARTDYSNQLAATRVYNALAAVTGAGGGAAGAAGVLNAAGADNQTANQVLGVSGAVVSAGGTIVFSLLAGAQDPSAPRAQFERMLVAHERAVQRYDDVNDCQQMIVENPAVVEARTDTDSLDLQDAKQSFSGRCRSLWAPIVPPSSGPRSAAGSELTDDQRRSLARGLVNPTAHYAEIETYLRTYCKIELPQPLNRTSANGTGG